MKSPKVYHSMMDAPQQMHDQIVNVQEHDHMHVCESVCVCVCVCVCE